MGHRRMTWIRQWLPTVPLALLAAAHAPAQDLPYYGDFVLSSREKTGPEGTLSIPSKPLRLRVSTDGSTVQVTTDDGRRLGPFQVYRDDGIARLRPGRDSLAVLPGLQAFRHADGILRHLRLSRAGLTITTFPGRSDQTQILHAAPATAKAQAPESR
jgi:hypothetical protein